MRLLAVLALAGCSGGGIAAADYARELSAANCDYQARCGLFDTTQICEGVFPVTRPTSFLAALDQGRTTYDADKAEQCVNAIRTTPCDASSLDGRFRATVCDEVIAGAGLAGDSCAQNLECASGACGTTTCPGQCCVGSCVTRTPPAAKGEPCATRPCEARLACDNTKVCVDLFPVNAACTSYLDCADGLLCLGDPGFCKPAPHLGEACPDGGCADLAAECRAGTCVAVGLAGDPCPTGDECASFYTCVTGACVAPPAMATPADPPVCIGT
ncbi:MAG: hypothetical protein ABI678_02005 [Kofleriaceae bacterium]